MHLLCAGAIGFFCYYELCGKWLWVNPRSLTPARDNTCNNCKSVQIRILDPKLWTVRSRLYQRQFWHPKVFQILVRIFQRFSRSTKFVDFAPFQIQTFLKFRQLLFDLMKCCRKFCSHSDYQSACHLRAFTKINGKRTSKKSSDEKNWTKKFRKNVDENA